VGDLCAGAKLNSSGIKEGRNHRKHRGVVSKLRYQSAARTMLLQGKDVDVASGPYRGENEEVNCRETVGKVSGGPGRTRATAFSADRVSRCSGLNNFMEAIHKQAPRCYLN